MKVDLHCHSNLSDGELSPLELIQYAGKQGIDMLAITDHDCAQKLPEVSALAKTLAIELVPGIEISATWGKIGVHVVGLNICLDSIALLQAVAMQSEAREHRAQEIDACLAKLNIHDSYTGAKTVAGDSQIGRPHFAQYLLEAGFVKDLKTAYKKYLGAGKVGDVKCFWPDMNEVIGWIHEANGQAVLAHPAKYKLTRRKLDMLCREFKEAGGDGIEVVSGMQSQDITDYHEHLSLKYSFFASCGSDFHGPASSWHDLGKMAHMPVSCKPIWELW